MPQEPLNSHDLAWIQQQVELHSAEETVQGITTSETLYGGPRGEGLVHVVRHLVQEIIPGLVKSTENLLSRTEALETLEAKRRASEQAKSERDKSWNDNWTRTVWTIGGGVALLVITRAYTIFGWLAAHLGIHIPGY